MIKFNFKITDSRLASLEESVKTIIKNQDKLEKLANQVIKEQKELKEMFCTYQQQINNGLEIIIQQTKSQEELSFLNVNKFLILSNILFHTD